MITTDDKTTESRPVAVIPIAVIGTGDATRIAPGTEAITPGLHTPNFAVQTVVQPIVAIVIRFANNYGGSLLGLLTAAMTPIGAKVLYTSDFLTMVVTCASLALPGAAVLLLKDILTISKQLEGKYPLLTGSI